MPSLVLAISLAWIVSAGAGMALHWRGRRAAVRDRGNLVRQGINGSARAVVKIAIVSETIRLGAKTLALVAGLVYAASNPPASGATMLRFWIIRLLLFAFLWALDLESFYGQRARAAIVAAAIEQKATQRRRASDVVEAAPC